jgi:protein-S-isoprenylcysteine O-methyltransferase Ste14
MTISLTTASFLLWFTTTLAANFIRLPHYKAHYSDLVRVSKKDLTEYLIMTAIAAGFVFVPGAWYVLDLFSQFTWQQNIFVVGFGAILSPISLWLFYKSHADLKKQWSPSLEIRENHELVVSGIYKYTRNPMYLAVLVWAFAQAVLVPNLIAGSAALVSLLPLFLIRLPREEKMMSDHFGEAYSRYKSSTCRLIPFIF